MANILSEFLLLKSSVEKMASNSWGRKRMAKVMAISELENVKILFVIPITNPLITKQVAEATRAMINLPERKPSSRPPGEMGLATPFFRHLASPREAEKQERMKVSRKRGGVYSNRGDK